MFGLLGRRRRRRIGIGVQQHGTADQPVRCHIVQFRLPRPRRIHDARGGEVLDFILMAIGEEEAEHTVSQSVRSPVCVCVCGITASTTYRYHAVDHGLCHAFQMTVHFADAQRIIGIADHDQRRLRLHLLAQRLDFLLAVGEGNGDTL